MINEHKENWVKISEEEFFKDVPEHIKELWSKGKLLPPKANKILLMKI